MQKIEFTGAVLQSFTRTHKEGRAHFSCGLTQALSDAMGWGDVPDSAIATKMDGDIKAVTANFTPQDKELKAHAVDLTITTVDSFQVVRLQVERQKGAMRREVRFIVGFAAPDTCALLEAFMLRCGGAKGKLLVSYTEQMKLATGEEEGEVGE